MHRFLECPNILFLNLPSSSISQLESGIPGDFKTSCVGVTFRNELILGQDSFNIYRCSTSLGLQLEEMRGESMKGVVFTEFIEMVEKEFGVHIAEDVISSSELDSGGAYTSVGTYSHQEMLSLIENLSRKTKIDHGDLIKSFGNYLHRQFEIKYKDFFEDQDCFGFIKSIDSYIHKEVKKLYTDAELPKFEHHEPNSKTLQVTYSSSRPFADLAEGMFKRTLEYFDEGVEMSVVESSKDSSHSRQFSFKKA